MARAPVSKTGGCRFESCHSCQAETGVIGRRQNAGQKPPAVTK
jgi:hypothetical protein